MRAAIYFLRKKFEIGNILYGESNFRLLSNERKGKFKET